MQKSTLAHACSCVLYIFICMYVLCVVCASAYSADSVPLISLCLFCFSHPIIKIIYIDIYVRITLGLIGFIKSIYNIFGQILNKIRIPSSVIVLDTHFYWYFRRKKKPSEAQRLLFGRPSMVHRWLSFYGISIQYYDIIWCYYPSNSVMENLLPDIVDILPPYDLTEAFERFSYIDI